MDIGTLIDMLIEQRAASRVALNPVAQFGRRTKRYLGAELLPERTVDENSYEETDIRYKTVIANDGGRYSPSQIKRGGQLIGAMWVSLGDQDIAAEFTARDYDKLRDLLRNNRDMEGVVVFTRWLETSINLALIEKIEQQRWQALVDAEVMRRGNNNYMQRVTYPKPVGHRISVAADPWSDPTVDPLEVIIDRGQMLQRKGYAVSRNITSTKNTMLLLNNPIVQRRIGGTQVIQIAGPAPAQVAYPTGTITMGQINAYLRQFNIGPIQTYDEHYETQLRRLRFMPEDAFVMVAETGRDEEIITLEDEILTVPNTLGYVAVGIGVGQDDPGRVIRMEHHESKPPRVTAEGWQTTLPVLLDPEAVVVLRDVA